MRPYLEKKENSAWWTGLVKGGIAIAASFAVMFLLTLICSMIIAGTNTPETAGGTMMIIVSAITSLLMSVLLTLLTKSKAILCALYSFIAMAALKLLLTNIMVHTVTFGRQGIVGLIFTAVFCLVGALLGGNLRK